MQVVDLLLEPTWIVPIEPGDRALEGHAVVVDGGAIVDLLPAADAKARYAPREHVELPGHVVLPGFVNAHVHNPMTLLRGLADDAPLATWLREHVWPVEARWVGEEFVRDGAELAIVEMLRSGTTTCSELYFFPDVLAATYRAHGFRAVVGAPILEFPTAWARDADEYLAKADALVGDADGLVGYALAPHAPYTVSDPTFERVLELAEARDLLIHTHVHESSAEIDEELVARGVRPFERLRRLGVVSSRLLAAHMTHLTPEEIELVAELGATVVHCPESNMKLANGFCPVDRLLDAGARVIVGTDGPASNNDLDMLGELRTAALLVKGASRDATKLPAIRALRMATIDAARALRLDHLVGSIEPGKRADLIAVDLSQPETSPVYDPISQLLYAAHRGLVREAWIDGKRRLRAGVVEDVDLPGVLAKARAWRERIAGGAGA